MSKFFNETKKARDWAPNEEVAKDPDLQVVLESMRDADAVSAQVTETRVRNAHRIKIPHQPGVPLIVGNGSSNGYGEETTAKRAVESYRALRTRLLRQQTTTGLRSVVITSALAGEGKTLTGLNLAQCCAQLHNQRVLLVDADLRTRGLTRLLGLPSGPGLSEVLSSQVQFEDAAMATDTSNLYVVGAGEGNPSIAELFTLPRWKEFMGWCGESFKLVLVDAPPILPLADFELISAECDGVLMIVLARKTQRELLLKASAQVDPKKLLGVVFNAVDRSRQEKDYYQYYGQKA
jgi:protein-tyrosine kinase